MDKKYCEFIGDEHQDWDEVPRSKRLCKHAGFAICVLHDSALKINDSGWRECCPECKTPFYKRKTK